MPPKYDVFISHAGEDKAKLAVLVYEALKRRGISAFLDERELQVAGDAVEDMDHAMRTALVGVFLLSPEFALKWYPMLELECFLRRAGLLQGGAQGSSAVRPKLIPVFYRLTVAECKYVGAFSRVECDPEVRDRFRERVEKGETSLERVLEHLTLLTRRTGVENKHGAGNDDSEEMAEKRKALAEKICDEVNRVVVARLRESDVHEEIRESTEEGSKRSEDVLHSTFFVPKNPEEVVLDFSSAFEDGRPKTYEAKVLREVLRFERSTGIVSIIGEGGVGKSCILREVGRHKEVKNRFPGGVYFISLGMEASVGTLRSELLRILRVSGGKQVAEKLRDEHGMGTILEEMGKLLRRERSLVLLDDVWERNGVKGRAVAQVADTLSGKYGGVLVVTTRSASIAQRGHVVVQIDKHEAVSETSRKILLRYSKFSEEEVEREALGKVIEKLLRLGGGLPVCLAVIGRGVGKLSILLRGKRVDAWVAYWKKIRGRKEPLLWEDVDEYKGLGKTVSVALVVLEENADTCGHDGTTYTWTEMYRSLCVMKKQTVMPMSVLERLWRVSGEGVVWAIAEGFASVGLGEVVFDEREGFEGLKIHDLLHDFSLSSARRKGEICKWHKSLLDRYMSSRADGNVREWWRVSNDGYIYENVCRHLRESSCIEELVGLLLRAEWTSLRHEEGGLVGWKRDFAECLEGVSSSARYEREKDDLRKGLCAVRDAVWESWTYVKDNKRELGYQVFGRLMGAKEGAVGRYLESMLARHPRPWLRPLSGFLSETGEVKSVGEFQFPTAVLDSVLHTDPLFAMVAVGKEVALVDFEEKRVTKRCAGHSEFVEKLWMSEDGAWALSWSWDMTIRKWDVRTGKELQVVRLQYDGIIENWRRCAMFSPDGKLLATGFGDGRVAIWEVRTGERVRDIMCFANEIVMCLAMSSDGSRIVIGGEDGSLLVWNIIAGAQEGPTVRGHKEKVWCVTFSAEGDRIVSGSADGTVRLWDMKTKAQIGDPYGGSWPGLVLTRSQDGQHILIGDTMHGVCVWNCRSGEVEFLLPFPEIGLNCICISATKRFVVAGGVQGQLLVWDVDIEAASKVGEEPHGHEDEVECLTRSADGRFYVSGSADETLRIWDSCSEIILYGNV